MNILFLAYELDGFALAEVAKKLAADGHKVTIANGDSWCFISDTTLLETYRKYNLEYVTFEVEYLKLYRDDYEIDFDYLKNFEAKYCIDKNIRQLAMADGFYNSWPRFPFYTKYTNKEYYYWIELRLKWMENILMERKPDFIFTISNNYFEKNVLWQMAKALKIKMDALIHFRIRDLHYFHEDIGFGIQGKIPFDRQLGNDSPCWNEALEYITTYCDNEEFTTYYNCGTGSVKSKLNVKEAIKDIYRHLRFEVHSLSNRMKRRRFDKWFRGNKFSSNRLLTPFWILRQFLNKMRYIFKIGHPFTMEVPKDENYIYWPLHMVPESATLTLSTEYHESDIIRHLSKELPVELKIVVKESPMMIGERPYSYYKVFLDLPNVILADPLISSKSILRRARGVAGISGTTMLEAAFLQKPTLTFGNPEFINCVDYFGYSDVKKFMKACASGEKSRNFNQTVSHVANVFANGIPMPKDVLLNGIGRGSAEFNSAVEVVYNHCSAVAANIVKDLGGQRVVPQKAKNG